MTSLTLLPAVDVAAGRAAQVIGCEQDEPLAVAQGWARAGATWLHLVDLDRAHRRGDNVELLDSLVRALRVPVQVSGGIENQQTLDWALATGAARVNLASTALLDPDWVRDAVQSHAGRIAVGIDVRGEDVVARGTQVRIGSLDEVLPSLSGMSGVTFVVADASRDGQRAGADVNLFREVAQRVAGPVIASGGVRDLDDIRSLRSLTGDGVCGAVLGSALYHGAFTLAQALEAAR